MKRTAEGPRTTAELTANRRLREGHVPWHRKGTPFRGLAYTCGTCGDLVTRQHLRKEESAGTLRHPCHNARHRDFTRRYRAEKGISRSAVRETPLNQALREVAHRHRYPWTGPELEVASRGDLSAEEVAKMLGRTLQAVRHIRGRMEVEPKLQRLAHGGSPTP